MRGLPLLLLVAWLVGGAACSSSGNSAGPPTKSCDSTSDCPGDQACAYVDRSDQECVPLPCAVLSSCCVRLDLIHDESDAVEPTSAERDSCYEAVVARDAKACDALLKKTQQGGHCVVRDLPSGWTSLCDDEGKSCDPSFDITYPQGSCCDGSVCNLDNDEWHCLSCVAGTGSCSVDEPCCEGSFCSYALKCQPLKDNGQDCDSFTDCKSSTCESGKCTKYTPPVTPPAPAPEGSASASSPPCESSWCDGCTGTCCSYCAGTCQTRCYDGGDF